MLHRFALAAVVVLSLSGCAWSNKVYGANCRRAGVAVGTPAYRDCLERERRAGQRQTLNDLGGAAVVGAAVYGASQQATPIPGSADHIAPLIAQSVSGYQRVCQYQTPSQVVSVTVAASTSCPTGYRY